MSRAALVILAVLLIPQTAPGPVFAVEDCVYAARLSEEGVSLLNNYPPQAANKLKDALTYCGQSASLHYNYGVALYKQNKITDARDQMEMAVRLNPGYAKAANDLAYIYASHLNDKRRAWIYAHSAVRLDPQNKAFRETLALTTELDIETPPQIESRRPDAIAVIIGNRNYRSSRIPAVEYAHRDASLVKQYLDDSLGYLESNIIYLTDANAAQMKKLFGEKEDHRGVLYDRINEDASTVVIYYTGHGAHDPAAHENYLLPANADAAALGDTSYSLSLLYENLAKLNREKKPRSIMVIIDASFSRTFQDGGVAGPADPAGIDAAAPVLAMKNAAAFVSAQDGQISSGYPEKGHGLFTYLFVQALRERMEFSATITVGDMEKMLTGFDGVNETAHRLYNRDQIPRIVGNRNIPLMY